MNDLLADELFAELHRVYQQIEALPKMYPMDELKVLNEVGYQVTWLCWRSGTNECVDMERFVREVYADMGLKDSAEVVFSLVFAVVTLVNCPPLDISRTAIDKLSQLNKVSRCGRLIDNFIAGMNRSGKQFSNRFDPPKDTSKVPENHRQKAATTYCDGEDSDDMLLSEETTDYGFNTAKGRVFTLDDIVDYAQKNLSLDTSQTIQNMLYRLLSEDGTEEEREKVASIPKAILNRTTQPNIVGQMVGTQTILGNADDLKNLLQSNEVKKLLNKP